MLRRHSSGASITERVGGRWAVSPQGFLLIVAGILLSIFAGEAAATHSVESALLWLVVAGVGVGVASAFLFTMSRLPAYRNRRVTPVSLRISLGNTILGSALIAGSMGIAASLLGLQSTMPQPAKTVITFLMGAVFAVAIILLLDRWDRARQTLSLLAEQQVNTAMDELSQAILLADLRATLVQDVNEELRPSREQIQVRLDTLESRADAAALADVSGELLSMANGAIRPLSARLWNSAVDDVPRVRWWKVLAETIRRAPFYPFALAAINIVGNLPTYVEVFGAGTGLGLAAISTIALLFITIPANVLLRRFPERHASIYLGALLLTQLGAIPMSILRESLVPGTGGVSWIVAQMVAGTAIVLVSSAVGSWWNVRDLALEAHQQALTSRQVEATARSRAVAELVREASRLLHGSVQTRLVACAMTSERAILNSDSELMKSSLVEAARILASIELSPAPTSTLLNEVQRKVDLWQELCDISLQMDAKTDEVRDERRIRMAGQVVEEGISNAVRHGDADALSISLGVPVPGMLRIEILDNGCGPTAGAGGMGSALLSQATEGRWSLEATPRGTLLIATLTVEP